MISETMEAKPATAEKSHATFFRQSGWLMIASLAGGMMSWGVHFLSKLISEADYGTFVTLLMLVSIVPTIPLQMVFVQQTARALATGKERQLSGMIRLVWFWITAAWLVFAGIVLVFQQPILAKWNLQSGPLWIALMTMLFSLWSPIFGGALQGRQDFFWMGWGAILSGVVRIIVGAALVIGLRSGATGMLMGAMLGAGVATGIAMWRTRDLWTLPKEFFDLKGLLAQGVPLLLGFAAFQFMFASDTMFAKPHFSESEMAAYGMAGTLSRALLWLVLPLASVMFPKIVHSSAKAEKTNLLGMVLIGTAVLAICGAVSLSVLGPWIVQFVSKKSYVAATSALLPWYAGAMIPYALANVLVNDLLARDRFKIVPFAIVIAAGYGFTLAYALNHYPGRMELVLQILGGFNFLLLAVCAWAAFRKSPKPDTASE